MADVSEEVEDRGDDERIEDRRFRVRVIRDDRCWADGYGPDEKSAQADAVKKLDTLPRGFTGKFY